MRFCRISCAITPPLSIALHPSTSVVDDQADYLGNAFAVYSANYIHFWTNPIDWEIRGTSDWVRNVFVHELTHIVTLKAAYKGLPFQIGIVNASRANENPDFSFTLGLYHLAMSTRVLPKASRNTKPPNTATTVGTHTAICSCAWPRSKMICSPSPAWDNSAARATTTAKWSIIRDLPCSTTLANALAPLLSDKFLNTDPLSTSIPR